MVHVAEPHEAEVVAGLMTAFRDHLGYARPSDDAVRAGVERLLDDPLTDFLVAEADGAPAGVCQLRYRWGLWLAGTDCLLEDLFVTDAARGRGIGRALVAAAIERAREGRGARRMELDTNERNSAAIALYESFGFRTESSSAVYERGRDLYYRLHL